MPYFLKCFIFKLAIAVLNGLHLNFKLHIANLN